MLKKYIIITLIAGLITNRAYSSEQINPIIAGLKAQQAVIVKTVVSGNPIWITLEQSRAPWLKTATSHRPKFYKNWFQELKITLTY